MILFIKFSFYSITSIPHCFVAVATSALNELKDEIGVTEESTMENVLDIPPTTTPQDTSPLAVDDKQNTSAHEKKLHAVESESDKLLASIVSNWKSTVLVSIVTSFSIYGVICFAHNVYNWWFGYSICIRV